MDDARISTDTAPAPAAGAIPVRRAAPGGASGTRAAAALRQLAAASAVRLCRFGVRATGARPIPPLLILGHMRSGSTLLMHLLMSHPDITGCGERNVAYRTPRDLRDLAIAARARRWVPYRRFRYVVDQINHDRFTPVETLLDDPALRLVFLTREPRPALASLLQLTREHYEAWTPDQALGYYDGRLETLARIARGLAEPARALALTYEQLVGDPTSSLLRLQRFLELPTGFSEEYETQSFTGQRGDPSMNIRAGRIVRPADAADRAAARELPAAVIAQASRRHDDCQLALQRLGGAHAAASSMRA